MIQTTDENEALSVEEFYDALAADYDTMTGFEKRFVQEKPFFRLLVERYSIRTALDAGSGTGFHSLLLAQQGVGVTAVDLSGDMLEGVKSHAERMNLHITTVRSNFQDLEKVLKSTFDAVFCMGNSLAHLLAEEDLRTTLRNFSSLVKPQGILFIQNLNYDRILVQRERIQSVKEAGNKTFVRFYDFGENRLSFNILTIERGKEGVRQSMRSVQLRLLLSNELVRLLLEYGFSEISLYGGISMDQFDAASSKDLVVLAKKQNQDR
jgi:2-polyprenyl-3-methyl-5-hydroxy-6-metoxy-1,4-benzoquinol methylase